MHKHLTLFTPFILISVILFGCAPKPVIKEEKPVRTVTVFEKADQLKSDFHGVMTPVNLPDRSRITSIKIDTVTKIITIDFNRNFARMPFRENNVKTIYSVIKHFFGPLFQDYHFTVSALNKPIEQLIPNYFRPDTSQYDYSRIPPPGERPAPVIQNISKKFIPENGLFNRNIVVWPSHGWYYNNNEDRWEWQRPRLFQSVEDLTPLAITVPYLIPMLENAGANVFDPRERDIQTHEVVVDNDTPADVHKKYYVEKSSSKKNKWKTGAGEGFAYGNPPYPNDYNPFTKGTFRFVETDTIASASVSYIPDIPETGYYSVYVAYNSTEINASDAHYAVYHDGIKTDFKVNQKIGGTTWEYLGEFKFNKGYNQNTDKVVLLNKSDEPGTIVSADGVRFGGGMGVVMRGGRTSGRAKIFEGSRYYLQYLGMPDTLVYNLNNNKNDYNDDYQSRPEYVNYLYGNPYGPSKDRTVKGLGIPIDLSLAFHTDAGVTHNDTTVGTLSIYSITGPDTQNVYPDGVSRFANRDLADIMQTQIVDDIRKTFDPSWNRRNLENARYSEAFRPNVPAVLIELLSHQNFLDTKFFQDPNFRFTVARAMYKGMLRFLSVQYGFKYVVQPLPVKSFSAVMDSAGEALLKWIPKNDPLEPTAVPDKYVVYTRINGGDFDNGTLVDQPSAVFKGIKPGVIYSYKVTAVNDGGESFPSEILSLCETKSDKKPVLIVNGFERVSAPASIQSAEYSGFLNNADPGVPDKYDLSFTGTQYDFDSTSQWISNDDPGWGASHANYETKIIAGNTFDYPYLHGKSILAAGYPFVSVSAKAVMNGTVNLKDYKTVDLILGEQKSTPWQRAYEDSARGIRYQTFPQKLQSDIKDYLSGGGNIFISGSYVGSDLMEKPHPDSSDASFAHDVLKFSWVTNHAAKTGGVFSSDSLFMHKFKAFDFNEKFNNIIYAATSPDAIGKFGGSSTILRYSENQFSAGTAYKSNYGVVVFGFPFETILGQKERDEVMSAVLSFLK